MAAPKAVPDRNVAVMVGQLKDGLVYHKPKRRADEMTLGSRVV